MDVLDRHRVLGDVVVRADRNYGLVLSPASQYDFDGESITTGLWSVDSVCRIAIIHMDVLLTAARSQTWNVENQKAKYQTPRKLKLECHSQRRLMLMAKCKSCKFNFHMYPRTKLASFPVFQARRR